MERIAQRIRRVCTSTSGLSLVEVLVAAAIVSIVSVLLVFAFYTMGAINKKASDLTNADEALSEEIALDGTKDSSSRDLKLNLGGTELDLGVTINTYTTDDGRSFTTFEYDKASGTSP
jgi:prepilin-type N-terminal cleavage/methylation domain-containing protein